MLEPLAADRIEIAPPPDLYYRTLARVAECATQSAGPPAASLSAASTIVNAGQHELPHAPAALPRQIKHRPLWRRADLLVAASILIVLAGAGISGILRLRDSAATTNCANNLRVFYTALNSYHDQHKHFPDVTKETPPRDVAGMVVPMLIHAGTLNTSDATVRCPGKGLARPCPVSYEQAKAMSSADFLKIAPKLMSCYAYSLGYYDEAGNYHPPQHREGFDTLIPLMSDRPPYTGQGNSLNHGGRGQNILFQDGHVTFTPSRFLGSDDIFLNDKGHPGAGRGTRDNCLGQSTARPGEPE
jgi:prepilin-type processing-associated H-X9-DG protein